MQCYKFSSFFSQRSPPLYFSLIPSGPHPDFEVWGTKCIFTRQEQDFLFIICLENFFWAQQNLGGTALECPPPWLRAWVSSPGYFRCNYFYRLVNAEHNSVLKAAVMLDALDPKLPTPRCAKVCFR